MPPFQIRQERQEAHGQVNSNTRQNPYLPPGPQPLIFDAFNGCDNNTTRPGVSDDRCYWIDGFMPIAKRNLRTLYGIGAASYTASGTTVVFYDFANIGSTPYMIVFLANGSVVAVNTTSLAVTTILSSSTITTPSITTCGMSQWGNQYVIIVADQTNGYWLWDGAVAYKAGSIGPTVSVTNVGGGYTLAPTVVITGGHGSGSSLAASVSNGQVVSISVIAPGSGYTANDVISVGFAGAPSGGTGGSVTASVSGNTLVSLSVVSGGSGYSNSPTFVFGGGSAEYQATAYPIITAGTITGTSITSRGKYGGTPTIGIVDLGVTAVATAMLMPFGIDGTCVETYSGHVWVADGLTVYFSAPGAPDDFATSNGGGNFTGNDSNIKVKYTQLIASNGFLYLIGDSSVFYISGVQTSGVTPPTTSFTNQNADPEVGSPYPQSVIPFGRNVLMANSYGVHAIMGGSVRKVSEMMDGVYLSVANFGGLQLSSAQATLFGNRAWMILVKLVDPVTGSTVNKILMWDGGQKWWASSQEITLTYIKHQEINSVITAYGTNGTVIHPLFQSASGSLSKIVQSRLYDAPGGIAFRKSAGRFWSLSEYYSTVSPNLIVSIDNESGTQATLTTITGATATGFFPTPPQGVGQKGVLTGLTIRTTAADMAFIVAALGDNVIEYRG